MFQLAILVRLKPNESLFKCSGGIVGSLTSVALKYESCVK